MKASWRWGGELSGAMVLVSGCVAGVDMNGILASSKDTEVADLRGRLNRETNADVRPFWQQRLACIEAAPLTQEGFAKAGQCDTDTRKAMVVDLRARAATQEDQVRADRLLGAAACIELATKPAAQGGEHLASWDALLACIEAHKGERPGQNEAVAAAAASAPPSPAPRGSAPSAPRPAQLPVAEAASSPPSAPPRATASPGAPGSYVVAAPQPAAYALIIGIEKYRDVPAPTGARADAEKFAKLARQTLGVPESHIKVALDDRASKGDIEKHLEWLKANAQAGSRIYFFFSGHGAPEPSTGTSYVLPYDGDPRYLEGTALRLQTVLTRLQETKAKEVLAVMDSCFSGAGGRSVLPPGARALVRVQAAPVAAQVALFSAASGAETSGPSPDAPGEGLFTQKILEGLGRGQADMNGDGQVSLEELRDWVKPRVTREAKRDNRDQTPNLFLGKNVASASNFIVAWGLATK